MAKKSKKTAKNSTKKSTKNVGTKNVSKKSGNDGKKFTRNNSKEKETRKRTVSKKSQIPKQKPNRKTSDSGKVSVPGKRSSKSRTSAKQNTKQGSSSKGLSIKKPRGKNQLDISFQGVKKLSKKIESFKAGAKDAIKKQLKQKGGKPPKAVIVVVDGTKGKGKKKQPVEAARVSPVDMPINEKTIFDFTNDYLDELEQNYLSWVELREIEELDDDDTGGDENYGNFDPDNINGLTIKFIY